MALTFDDGPDPAWTPRVLAALERHGATATFFVDASRAQLQGELVQVTREAGHEVGFHCLDHVRHSERSEAEIAADTAAGLGLLDAMGVRPSAWRTPWGVVTEATRRVAAEYGLELWGWNADSHDWRGDGCAEMLAALEAEGAMDGDAVVLMHDGIGPGALRQDCAETVRLTVKLLDGAARKGLRPVALTGSGVEVAAGAPEAVAL